MEQAMDYCTARANSETMRPGANALDLSEWDDEDIVEWVESLARWGRRALALRDVLTPRTCSGCKHANTEDTLDGWCYCAAPPPPADVLFSGPDQVEKWAQKQANGKRFPFWGMAVPLDERCKGWEPREGEGGAQ